VRKLGGIWQRATEAEEAGVGPGGDPHHLELTIPRAPSKRRRGEWSSRGLGALTSPHTTTMILTLSKEWETG